MSNYELPPSKPEFKENQFNLTDVLKTSAKPWCRYMLPCGRCELTKNECDKCDL